MTDSCRDLFQRLEVLPLYSQYIFSLSIFVIKNKHLYNTNNQIHSVHTRQSDPQCPHKIVRSTVSTQDSQIHSVHTRFKTNLHPPIANLTKFQKGIYYSGIKIFNNFPHDIKDLANEITLFWNALKRFLLINSFHNSNFNYQR